MNQVANLLMFESVTEIVALAIAALATESVWMITMQIFNTTNVSRVWIQRILVTNQIQEISESLFALHVGAPFDWAYKELNLCFLSFISLRTSQIHVFEREIAKKLHPCFCSLQFFLPSVLYWYRLYILGILYFFKIRNWKWTPRSLGVKMEVYS